MRDCAPVKLAHRLHKSTGSAPPPMTRPENRRDAHASGGGAAVVRPRHRMWTTHALIYMPQRIHAWRRATP
ncbi:hypothetical protein SCMU_41170 [Sinomonas cyclohexanicum]|uniref:Uncharacterized protein n=1 Tax=Sinomonas cyclohexanicum TaxID=322009 RepID=A0ABN6FNS2_SINCY|nr:hypothetical protein SCMU_41170 [Corynebacterium cyclohexanicum]